MNAHSVLWGIFALSITIGCSEKHESDKRTRDSKDSTPVETSTKQDDVSFSFALPNQFEEESDAEDEKDGGLLGGSNEGGLLGGSSGKFMDFFLSQHIKVTCEEETLVDFINLKGKKIRGILEVSLIQIDYHDIENDYIGAYDDETAEIREEHYDLDPKDYGIEHVMSSQNPEPEFADNDEVHSQTWTFIETLSIPFICNSAANIKLTNLASDTTYRVDARLYSKHERLKYAGSTDDFTSSDRSLELFMQKRRSDVRVDVVFEKH